MVGNVKERGEMERGDGEDGGERERGKKARRLKWPRASERLSRSGAVLPTVP